MRAPHLIHLPSSGLCPHFRTGQRLVYAGATGHLVAALLASLASPSFLRADVPKSCLPRPKEPAALGAFHVTR